MALADAVKGSLRNGQTITWVPPLDLTGATITATLRDLFDDTERAVAGSLTGTANDAGGEFHWAYDTADVVRVGSYRVKFLAEFGDSRPEISFSEDWVVRP
jgi:hypothetical protein